jgi:hypothetical protein
MPVENENIDFLDDSVCPAPLNLIIGHLRTVNRNYRELKDFAFSELKNWYCPVDWLSMGSDMVATIQPFKTGGYEVTVKNIDMKSFGHLMSSKGRGGVDKLKKIVPVPALESVPDSVLNDFNRTVEKHNATVDGHDSESCNEPACVLCSLQKRKGGNDIQNSVCKHGFEVPSCSWCARDSDNNALVTNKREKKVMNENDKIRSLQRSKKKIRQLIKQNGCDRLLTFTRRENNPDTFKSEDDWLVDFRKVVRLLRIAGVDLEYVATLEKHKKGNFHLHAAIVGHININTVRGIWWSVCGGRGMGNVQVSFKQHQTPEQRLVGVARYVSKYITKQIDNFDFNRKRYWASRSEPLEKPKRIILSAQDMAGALAELAGILALDLDILKKKVFEFGNKAGEKAGAWFNYEPSMQLDVPF